MVGRRLNQRQINPIKRKEQKMEEDNMKKEYRAFVKNGRLWLELRIIASSEAEATKMIKEFLPKDEKWKIRSIEYNKRLCWDSNLNITLLGSSIY